ncbi:unnamed protein product [Natator depressus]
MLFLNLMDWGNKMWAPCCEIELQPGALLLPPSEGLGQGRERRAQMVAMSGLASCPACQWEEAVGLQAVIAGGRTPAAGVDTRSPAATSQSRDCLWGGNPKTDTSWCQTDPHTGEGLMWRRAWVVVGLRLFSFPCSHQSAVGEGGLQLSAPWD